MPAPTIDLYSLIFETILRIDPYTLSRYTTIQDQLLWLLLIPHAILLLFLMGFGKGIAGGHKGMGYIISIIAYLFFIWSGIYGTFLVPITAAFWYILLGIGLFLFFISRIIHPATAGAMIGLAAEVGKKIGEKTVGKASEKYELQKQLAILMKERQLLQEQYLNASTFAAQHPGDTAAAMRAQMLSMQLAQKDSEISALKARL